MVVTMKMSMDLRAQEKYPVVMAPQNGGNCRFLEVSLSAGQEPWVVPEGVSVRMYFCRPDGTGGSYDSLDDGRAAWSASGNVVTMELIPQIFTQAGMVAAKMEFLQEGRYLQTFGFWIRVVSDCAEDAIKSEDYFNWSAWTSEELERMLTEARESGAFDGPQGPQGEKGEQGIPGVAQTPLFANSIEECTDISKVYVLPDGYIYAYLPSDGPAYTNLAGAVQEDYRLNSSGVAKALDGAITTDFIPVSQGDIVRVKGFDPTALVSGNYPYTCFYTAASESSVVASDKYARGDGVLWTVNGDVYEYTPFMLHTGYEHSLAPTITHIRINGAMIDGSEVIVTVNEEIVEGSAGGYSWQSTGHAFVPADYEDRILALEEHAAAIPESRIQEIESTLEGVQTAKPWSGKKWVAMGDSLTSAKNADGTDANTTKYYHTYIAEETGITVVNDGRGGTGYKRHFDLNVAFYQRALDVPTDADVITIFGSGNDLSSVWDTYGLGDVTDTGTDTICGCINTTLDNLFSVYPTANVGIITPTPWKAFYPFATEADGKAYRMTQLVEKLVEICRMRSIPCLDLYHCSGLRPWDKAFRDAVYTKDDVENDGELGGVHLDENGHKIIATKIRAFLESLING